MNPLIFLAPVIYFTATGHAALAAQHLDLSKVTAISITGEASSIVLTNQDSAPYEANLSGKRNGWFSDWYSSWFSAECESYGKMRVENATLYVDSGAAALLDPSDCAVTLNANVPAETSVTIEQKASQVKMSGNYSSVSVQSKAADFSFQGHANSFTLNGEAMRSQINLERSNKNEKVEINSHSLDASVSFPPQTPVSYKVEAKASWVDSALPNTAGANATVSVKAVNARVTIR